MFKTDNKDTVGAHIFEQYKLGKAPFKYRGCFVNDKPTSCAFCLTTITHCVLVESSDGKRFVVGSTCIKNAGDEGIIRAFKTDPAERKRKREMRHAREAKRIAKIEAYMNEHQGVLEATPNKDRDGESLWDAYEWIMGQCGNSGKLRHGGAWVKRTGKLISEQKKED